MTRTVLLSLDVSLTTGWCAGPPEARPTSGVLDVSFVDASNTGKRFHQFGYKLTQLILEHEPTCVGFEQPVYGRGGKSAKGFVQTSFKKDRLMMGFMGIVEFICANNGVACVEVPIQSWRRHFLGAHKYNREDAKYAALTRVRQLTYHKRGMTDDEAEAIGIWDYLCSLYSHKHAAHMTPLGANSRIHR